MVVVALGGGGVGRRSSEPSAGIAALGGGVDGSVLIVGVVESASVVSGPRHCRERSMSISRSVVVNLRGRMPARAESRRCLVARRGQVVTVTGTNKSTVFCPEQESN